MCVQYHQTMAKHQPPLAALQELRAGWVNSQQEAQDLHGQQVYAVAAALHALQTKLEW